MKTLLSVLMILASVSYGHASCAQGETTVNADAPLTAVTIADGRVVLADEQGLSVYIFDVDQGNVSNC